MSLRERTVLVVGGGFAGAATAFFLGRVPGLRVVLFEAEAERAVHSSGRNAGLLRGPSGIGAEADAVAAEGCAFVRRPPPDFPADPCFRAVGSLFVGRPEVVRRRLVGSSRIVGLEAVRARFPGYRPLPGAVAVCTPDDGVVDPRALLTGFLDGAAAHGVELAESCRVESLLRHGERVVGVRSERGERQGIVLLAAGAFAGPLGESVGSRVRLEPRRRHLLVTEPDRHAEADAPYLWDLDREYYFRAEDGGFLLCAGDDEPTEPGPCATDPAQEVLIRERSAEVLPASAALARRRFWAGHRTHCDHEVGVLGPDPDVPGLYWAAGLGGHGLSGAAAVGRRVAASILAGLASRG